MARNEYLHIVMPAAVSPFFRWGAVIAVTLAACARGLSEPLPAPIPRVLSPARLESLHAEKYAEQCRERGIQGIIIEGAVDDLRKPTPVMAGEDGIAAGLVEDLRRMQTQLAACGVDRNFLAVSVAPEQAWFTDRAMTRIALARFQEAGVACRKAGLRGIAVDVSALHPLLDYRWPRYDLAHMPAPAIAQSARDFGRRALRAFLREYPRGEMLVMDRADSAVGPLWFALFNGLVESLGAADDLRIHLLTRETWNTTTPEALRISLDRLNRRLCDRMDPETLALWRGQGGLAAGIRPIELLPAGLGLTASEEILRIQAAAAKAYSHTYVWVDGIPGNGPEITPEEALPAPLRAWTAITPLDKWRRIGTAEDAVLGEVLVFGQETTAAVLDWDGFSTAFTQTMAMRGASQINLRTNRERHFAPRDRQVTVPACAGPVWLEGLPLRAWALRAGLWLDLPEGIGAESRRITLRFGMRNALRQKLKGTLQALTPPAYSLGAASFTLSVPPGDDAAYSRNLQGIFRTGEAVNLRLTATPRGGKTEQREFAIAVLPKQEWAAPRDGVPAGPPVIADLDGDGQLEVAVCSRNGDLACYTGRGVMKWERRWAIECAGFAGPVRTPPGMPAVAVIDQKGRLRAVDGHGATVWEYAFGSAVAPGALMITTAPPGGVDTLAAGLSDRRVVCLPLEGPPYWEYAVDGPVIGVAQVGPRDAPAMAWSPLWGCVYAAVGGAAPSLCCIGGKGELRWQRTLEEAPSCGPALGSARGAPVTLVGSASGLLMLLDPATGESMGTIATGNPGLATLRTADAAPAPGPEILAAGQEGVDCYDQNGEPLWRQAIGGVAGMTAGLLNGTPAMVAAAERGSLEVFSGTGQHMFSDTRAAGALVYCPQLANLDDDPAIECVYVSEDCLVRTVELGPGHAAPRPGAWPAP